MALCSFLTKEWGGSAGRRTMASEVCGHTVASPATCCRLVQLTNSMHLGCTPKYPTTSPNLHQPASMLIVFFLFGVSMVKYVPVPANTPVPSVGLRGMQLPRTIECGAGVRLASQTCSRFHQHIPYLKRSHLHHLIRLVLPFCHSHLPRP